MTTSFRQDLIGMIPNLRGFARTLAGTAEAADDLVQDTLVRALKAQHQFTPGTNLKAWLFTIQRNIHINNLRRSKFQAQPIDDVPEDLFSVRPRQDSQLEMDDFQRAMAALTAEQREVVILVGANGLSYEDAAEICGCAVGTIKSRLSRARQSLFILMTGHGLVRRQSGTRHRSPAKDGRMGQGLPQPRRAAVSY